MNTTTKEWARVPLRGIAEIERIAVSPENIKSGTRYVGLENMTSSGQFVGVGEVANGDLASTKFAFTNEHILYGKLRPYLAKIARPDFCGVCSTDILPILPGPKVNRGYLLHFLRQPQMIDYASSRTSGANLPRLSPKALAEFEIPLPPLSEQMRIADILDKADAIRRKRQEANTQLEAIPCSTFIEMFGDPRSNPHGWKFRPLSELVERPITYGILKPGQHEPDGVAMLRIQDIRGNRVDKSDLHFVSPELSQQYSRTILSGGEIVISLVGTIGLVAVVPQSLAGSNVHRNLGVIVPGTEVTCSYLYHLLSSPLFPALLRTVVKGGNQALLNLGDLSSVNIPVPPLKLQSQFDQRMARYSEAHRHLTTAQQLSNDLFNSLVQRAFKGEL